MLLRIFLWTLAVLLQIERGESSYYRTNRCDRYSLKEFLIFDGTRTKEFRTFDGTCNNLLRPTDGAAGTAFRRLLPPAYEDGFDEPRGGQNGLPNPRKVSLNLFPDNDKPNARLSHMAMTFGQFLAHDVTGLGQPEGLQLDCDEVCNRPGTPCFGVDVTKPGLGFPNNPNVECITLRRTTEVPPDNLKFTGKRKARQQENTLTSYIDASQVYGVETGVVNAVRDLNAKAAGTLRTVPHPVNRSPPLRELLPPNFVGQFCRSPKPVSRPCPLSGDFLRTTENQALGTMHTLWAREHNRLAKGLSELNPRWNSDRVFLEARKILGAIMQHVTYNEWIPVILAPKIITAFGLNLLPTGKSQYFSGVSASIPNSMATAAMRFGHSLIQNTFQRRDPSRSPQPPSIATRDFFNPIPLFEANLGGLDAIVRGLATQRAQAVDSNIVSAVTQFLVQEPGVIVADLVALNIQRGRDHGLPSYNAFRKLAGLRKATTFDGFSGEIKSAARRRKLATIYDNKPDGVDLFVGGLSEDPLPGGQLGPTLSAILGHTFRDVRQGDRFWYETNDPSTGFTDAQLQQLRNANIARLICDNSDGITQMQPHPFQQQRSGNMPKSCQDLPRIDLAPWKDTPPVAAFKSYGYRYGYRY